MKALQLIKYGEIKDSVAIQEVQKPVAGAKDVLIEVKAASLNPIDHIIASGAYKNMIQLSLPTTIGFDVSGVVVEKGAEVTNLEIGDLVFSRAPRNQMGTIAEYVAINSSVVSKKPANLSFEEAAGLPLTGLTTIQALEKVGLKKNDKILIHAGSGGVGSFAIQYAKSLGAYVYTTTSTENVSWVKELGADRVIDYKKEDYKIIAKDVDIVFDTLGKNYTLEAFDVIRQGGKVTTVTGPFDQETARMLGIPNYKLPEEIATAAKNKSAEYKQTMMQPNGKQLDLIKKLVEKEAIKPVVDSVYSFAQSIEALEKLVSGRAKGKIIIALSSSQIL
jgi:NADPH:quinone reductase-like Zn-dependent oxidoreductase